MHSFYDPFLFLDSNLLYITVSKLLFQAFTEILKTNKKYLLVKPTNAEFSFSIQHIYEKVYDRRFLLVLSKFIY